jgi:hypothetical protein
MNEHDWFATRIVGAVDFSLLAGRNGVHGFFSSLSMRKRPRAGT